MLYNNGMARLVSGIYSQGNQYMREMWAPAKKPKPALLFGIGRTTAKRKAEASRSMTNKVEFAALMRHSPTRLETILHGCILAVLKSRAACTEQEILRGYIVDFYIPKYKLALEADGPHHENQKKYDELRDMRLRLAGYSVLRFDYAALNGNRRNVEQEIRDKLNYLRMSSKRDKVK